jgi:hypothetical protein
MKTLNDFIKIAKKEITNTNNAWGFGGSISEYYTYKNLVYRKAKFYYRHIEPNTEKIFYKYENENRIEITSWEFIELFNNI